MRFLSPSVITLAVGISWAYGCSGPAPSQPVAPGLASAVSAENSPNGEGRKVGQFIATWNPKTKTLDIQPDGPPIVLDNDLKPLSVDGLQIDQTGGSGNPVNTVDLVSSGCVDTPGTSFTCNVELRSFFPRALNNVFAQITAIEFDGCDTAPTTCGHAATNQVSANPLGLSNSMGLWGYANGSEAAQGCGNGVNTTRIPNALMANDGNGFNTGTQTWAFENTDDASVGYKIAVWASENYTSYQATQGTAPTYVNACTGGTTLSFVNHSGIALPFDLQFYASNYNTASGNQTFNVSRQSELTFGGTDADLFQTQAANLPDSSVANPAFWAFWDVFAHNVNTPQICYETTGLEPNRQFVVEFQDFDFNSSTTISGENDSGADLDFEAFLYEGTGEIDVLFETMTAGPGDTVGRANGAFSTEGMQNAGPTAATADFQDPAYTAGEYITYCPKH